MGTNRFQANPDRTPRAILARNRRAMSRSEVALKILIGSVLGAELVGGSTLLALGVYAGFGAIQSPAFSATWLLVFAVLGAISAVQYLPPFSRDRGRIADFLIDPKHLGGSLGYSNVKLQEYFAKPAGFPVYRTTRLRGFEIRKRRSIRSDPR
ncbi:hypothetical protein Pla100_32380 [Neorhodopirellula pilleata]|uniref:Uncharacterized protein n=1 Tax=Neorhodopirellula pilleata TaxID=2714738 RepID=A0A5C6A886_9BACT|nr:hypothetical protein Pla100_32380 [Neorhodopirellula pilleata]